MKAARDGDTVNEDVEGRIWNMSVGQKQDESRSRIAAVSNTIQPICGSRGICHPTIKRVRWSKTTQNVTKIVAEMSGWSLYFEAFFFLTETEMCRVLLALNIGNIWLESQSSHLNKTFRQVLLFNVWERFIKKRCCGESGLCFSCAGKNMLLFWK